MIGPTIPPELIASIVAQLGNQGEPPLPFGSQTGPFIDAGASAPVAQQGGGIPPEVLRALTMFGQPSTGGSLGPAPMSPLSPAADMPNLSSFSQPQQQMMMPVIPPEVNQQYLDILNRLQARTMRRAASLKQDSAKYNSMLPPEFQGVYSDAAPVALEDLSYAIAGASAVAPQIDQYSIMARQQGGGGSGGMTPEQKLAYELAIMKQQHEYDRELAGLKQQEASPVDAAIAAEIARMTSGQT